jgi:hypothetical protein
MKPVFGFAGVEARQPSQRFASPIDPLDSLERRPVLEALLRKPPVARFDRAIGHRP